MTRQAVKSKVFVLLLMVVSGYVGYYSRTAINIERYLDARATNYVRCPIKEIVRDFYNCTGKGALRNKYCVKYAFKRLTSPRLTCEGKVDILLMVTSSADHFYRRNVLRQTWCKDANYKHGNVRHVFLIGKTSSTKQQEEIVKEAEEYGDILQDDFKDAYRNLTLKTVMAFHWFARHCSNARYFMKTDDDMFVNILSILIMGRSSGVFNNTMFGHCYMNPKVINRTEQSKWFVPYDQYPGRWWPRYCDGKGYILPSKLALAVEKLIPSVPIITTEDAYIGECVERLNGKIQHYTEFSQQGPQMSFDTILQNVKSGRTISFHKAKLEQLRPLWNMTLNVWNR